MRSTGGRSGFSMIELLIAVILLTFSIVAYLAVLGSTASLVKVSNDALTARNGAVAEMEQIKYKAKAAWSSFPGNYYSGDDNGTKAGKQRYFNIAGFFTSLDTSGKDWHRPYFTKGDNTKWDAEASIVGNADDSSVPVGTYKLTITVKWKPGQGREQSFVIESMVSDM